MRSAALLPVVVTLLLAGAAPALGHEGCPRHCRCYRDADGYRTFNCSATAFSGLSHQHHPGVNVLNVRPNRGLATKLFPGMFRFYKNVKMLGLSNCSVSHVPKDAFAGLDYVEEIDLSWNEIEQLNGAVFSSLPRLRTLSVRGNPLRLRPWNALYSKSLLELDMGYCGLRALSPGFLKTPALTHLSLDGNRLETVGYDLPAGIVYLNLARNWIVNVPGNVLKALTHLHRIDASDNPVNCTCELLLAQDWLSGRGVVFENDVVCSAPERYRGRHLQKIVEDELCAYELLVVNKEDNINNIGYSSYDTRKSKRFQKLNTIYDPAMFQADQPTDAEVVFSNAETKAMGTHMESEREEAFGGEEDEGSRTEEAREPHSDDEDTINVSTPVDDVIEDEDDSEAASAKRDEADNLIDSPSAGRTASGSEASNRVHSMAGGNGTREEEGRSTADDEPRDATTEEFGSGEAEPELGAEVVAPDTSDGGDIVESGFIPYVTNDTSEDEVTTEMAEVEEDAPTSRSAESTTDGTAEASTTAAPDDADLFNVTSSEWTSSSETSAEYNASTTETYDIFEKLLNAPNRTVTDYEHYDDHTTQSYSAEETTRGEDETTPSDEETTRGEEATTPTEEETTTFLDPEEGVTADNSSTSKEEYRGPVVAREEDTLQSAGSYVVLALIVTLVCGLVLLAVCRRKKTPSKIRLPNDAESNLGTEMQDMDSLLPKPPENGVKIVPKDYGEPNGEVKEEAQPVLEEAAPEDGEEKREQNGGVTRATARLTVLQDSLPRTPVFIHKPYSD